MRNLEKLFKALANRRRLAILAYLKKEKEARVTEIAAAIKLSFKATSRHLNQLAGVEILEKEQRGLEVFYFLSKNMPPPSKSVIPYIPNSHE